MSEFAMVVRHGFYIAALAYNMLFEWMKIPLHRGNHPPITPIKK